ncbi:MAG: winged helix-turn-helix domain-containing protein, partial [Pseudomonadota bacterium]
MNTDETEISYRHWSLNVERQALIVDGRLQRLQQGVMRLLLYVVRREGEVISKEQLIKDVWGGRSVSDAAIYNRVSATRRAIGDEEGPHRCIQWDYGRGLRFSRPPETVRGTKAEIASFLHKRMPAGQIAGNPFEKMAAPIFLSGAAGIEAMRPMLGTYFVYYRTPSWPHAIERCVSVLGEREGRVVVLSTEHGKDDNIDIRQRERYRGQAELIDGRLYAIEQNTRPPQAVCLSALDAPHPFRPDVMTGLMIGSSWRLGGAPFTTRVVWRRVSGDLSIRDAIRKTGPYADDGPEIDVAIVRSLGEDCITYHG